MEFEEMQVIWNAQNNEKLYAINEEAMHKRIRQKGRSVNRIVLFVESMLIGVNFAVGLLLLWDAIADNESRLQLVLAAVYVAFALIGLFRRITRRNAEVQFDNTMLGDVDKAIWQIDYLIAQGKLIIRWYLVPLVILFAALAIVESYPLWLWIVILGLLPFGYYGGRWEINKWYLPKKRSLESLRETLTATPETAE